jgi:hypothetical protein
MSADAVSMGFLNDGTSDNKIAITPGGTFDAGDIAVVWVSVDGAAVITNVVDTLNPGNYTLTDNKFNSGLDQQYSLFYHQNVAPGPSPTFQANFNASFQFRRIWVFKVTGCKLSAPLDGHNGNQQLNPGLGVDAVTSGPMVNANQPALVFGVCDNDFWNAIFAPFIPAAGTGFTSIADNVEGSRAEKKRITTSGVSAPALFTSTDTANAGGDCITLGAIFDEVTGEMSGTSLGTALTAGTAIPAMGVPTTHLGIGSVSRAPGSQFFMAHRLNPIGTSQLAPTFVGNFPTLEAAMGAVNLFVGQNLQWSQDQRQDGIMSYTGFTA